ncbi:MAG: MFS transporter [Candidatus Lokiarchaeota archaeon]|nr:MFS transporter [Candidatus Lokiarchaeota archaeon]
MEADFNEISSKTEKKSIQKEPKFKLLQTCLIGLGFMSCLFAWAMYNFYLPRVLAGHVVEGDFYRVGLFTGSTRLLWTNVVMTLDNIIAILLQPYFGDLSDRLKSKYGRRTPFLLIGIPIAGFSMFFMPFAIALSTWWTILLSFIGLVLVFNIGMALYRAPVVALMPDLTPSAHRSMANVIINLMGGIGKIIGMYLPVLVGSIAIIKMVTDGYSTFENQDFFAMDAAVFWSAAIIINVILILYLIFVKEKPTGDKFWELGEKSIKFDETTLEIIPNEDDKPQEKYNTWNELKKIRNASEKSPWFMFISLFMWTMSADAFSTNFSLWGAEYALLSDQILGFINLVTSVSVAIFGIPAALLSKKRGRIWTMKIGIKFFIIAFIGIILFQEIGRTGAPLVGLIGIIVSMIFNQMGGVFVAIAAITVTWQLAPDNKVGTYTGLYYLFKQLGSVISPLFIGGIMSILTPMLGETGTWVVFLPYCLTFALLFYWSFNHVKKGEVGDEWNANE